MKRHLHLEIKYHKMATKQFKLGSTGRHEEKHKGRRIKVAVVIAFFEKRQIKRASVLRIFIQGRISMTTEYLVILIAGETKHLKSEKICSRRTE